MKSQISWNDLEKLIQDLVENQKKQLLSCGKRLVPDLTSDDILQPNDFPELENHPHFRYEEGVLAGLQTFEMALRALQKDNDLNLGQLTHQE